MNKPYLVLVNGVLWARKLTQHGAQVVVNDLNAKWLAMGSQARAVVGYDITTPEVL